MLTLKRFEALTDSYGAEPERWPDDVRADAEALLRVSPEAQQLLAEARELDEGIDAARKRADAASWTPSEEAAALARLRAGVAARLARSAGQETAARRLASRGTAGGGVQAEDALSRSAASDGSTARGTAVGGAAIGWAPWLRRWMLPVAQWSSSARLAGMAAAGGFLIAVGLFLGSMDATRPAPQVDVLAMLQPNPLPFLADQ